MVIVKIDLPTRTFSRERAVRNNAVHRSNGATLHNFTDLLGDGEIPGPHSLHEEDLLRLGSLGKFPRLSSRDGEGLLTQDVLPRLDREHAVLEVVAVGRRDVDDVDVGVRNELVVRGVSLDAVWRVDLG